MRGIGSVLGAAIASALLASGCGGAARLDAHEPRGSFRLEVVRASFPARQAISKPARLELAIRNSGSHTVPDVAVTLDSLSYAEHYAELAADQRPVWALEQGPGAIAKSPVESQNVVQPGGAQTAYVNTWALGPLAARRTASFVWRLTPVKSGVHTVSYTIAAGLAGRARAVAAGGGPVQGRLRVQIAGAPGPTHVDPATGRVVPGPAPLTP